jgi:NAD(P)-dependent dehydrogenase (short-subunit alcohol dehydrogenase family)
MNNKKFDLSNKTALITGAAGLLGPQHSAALLEIGAKIIITDISDYKLNIVKENLNNTFPNRTIESYVMDVSDYFSIIEVQNSLSNRNIYVDILVNNAAVDPKVDKESSFANSSRFEKLTKDTWNSELSVGLTGAFLCSQIFGSLMAESGKGGNILNIASDLSVIAPDQRLYYNKEIPAHLQSVKPVTYSVIKFGLVGLTKYLATYWADKGVRSNALSPGGVLNEQDEVFVKRVSQLIPLGRMASKDEYISAIQFLCSDASSYMNGQNIVMDGGRSVW